MEYKTRCCKADTVRKGRADIRCSKCDQDVTIEWFLVYQMLEKDGE